MSFRRFNIEPVYCAHLVYVGAHVAVGATMGVGCTIMKCMEEKEMRWCMLTPFAAITGGIFGGMAGAIPGVTPIAAIALYLQKSKN